MAVAQAQSRVADPQSGPATPRGVTGFFHYNARWIVAEQGSIVGLGKSNYINRRGEFAIVPGRELLGLDGGRSSPEAGLSTSDYINRTEGAIDDELGAHILITRGLPVDTGPGLARLLDARERKKDRSYRCYGGRLPRVATHLILSFRYGLSAEAATKAAREHARMLSDRLRVPLEGRVHNKNGAPDHLHLIVGTRVVEHGKLGRKCRDLDAVSETRLVPDRDRVAIYGSDAWSTTYTPVRWLACYMLQASGLAALSAALGGIGLAKAGTAAVEAVARRVADLGAGEYGAWHRGPQRYERSEGFGTFSMAPRLQLSPQHARSPVRLGLYGPEVGLPASLSHGRFEVEFNARLLPLRLQSVAGSAIGQDLCARAGIDPALLVRFHRASGRHIAATELTLLRPQADCNALAKVAADIVIDHVLGVLPRRSGR